MKVTILKESGYHEALFGLGLSYGITSEMDLIDYDIYSTEWKNVWKRLDKIAKKISSKDGGHNKFLESISVWIDLDAPRYFHSQFDTYRVGTTKQSESTMHTITKRELTPEDFEKPILSASLDFLNACIKENCFEAVKSNLPEGFLQRRVVCTNYRVLRNMILQRENHKLKEWKFFCDEIRSQVKKKDLLP